MSRRYIVGGRVVSGRALSARREPATIAICKRCERAWVVTLGGAWTELDLPYACRLLVALDVTHYSLCQCVGCRDTPDEPEGAWLARLTFYRWLVETGRLSEQA